MERRVETERKGTTMSESGNTIPCPNCGMPVASDDLFCGSCGQRLDMQQRTDSGGGAAVEQPPAPPLMPGPPPPPPTAPVAPPRAAAPQSAPPPPASQAQAAPPAPPPAATNPASPAACGARGSASSSRPKGKWRRRLLIGLALFGALMLCSLTLAVFLAFMAQMSP